jgi:hypothetical protein
MEVLSWRTELVENLAERPCCGYAAVDVMATEPSALTALALAGEGRVDGCEQVAQWLADIQSDDGSVGVREYERSPCWTTSLAVMVWSALAAIGRERYAAAIARGTDWIVNARGVAIPREDESGHDSSLEAWPWVEGTHAWVEPTSLHVLALKAAGLHDHLRTRNAVRMLADRQLPIGGFNYGNTYVMDQLLRPHLQPTGMALLALSSEVKNPTSVERSLAYLEQNLSAQTATVSLCWPLMALAAFNRTPHQLESWLEGAYQRTRRRDRSPLKLALILLASQGRQSFMVKPGVAPRADDSLFVETKHAT